MSALDSHRSDDARRSDLLQAPIRALAIVACVALFATMLLTFVDVIGRYVFNAPVQGAHQMIRALVAIMFFSGLPLVSSQEKHLTVGLFDTAFTGRGRVLQSVGVVLLSLIAMLVLAWQLIVAANLFRRNGEILDTIELPIYAFVYFMGLMSAMSAVVMIILLAQHLRALTKGTASWTR